MALADLSNILKIFGGSEPSPAEKDALVKEVLLMTLARASSSDANIDPVEVATVQKIVKSITGDELSESDVRLASRPELFQEAPFGKYLASVRGKLDSADKAKIVGALAKVIKSDTRVSALEIDFFNMVANELRAAPAEIAGLVD